VYVYIYTHAHTYIHACISCLRTCIRIYIHTYIHMWRGVSGEKAYVSIRVWHTSAYIHTYIHICKCGGGFQARRRGRAAVSRVASAEPWYHDVWRLRYTASYSRCSRMLTYAGVCWHMLACADVWRNRYSALYPQVLTYADVC
jgi:hypothetical protein